MSNYYDLRYNKYDTKHQWSTNWTEFHGMEFTLGIEWALLPWADKIYESSLLYWHYSIYISIIYLITIIILKAWMNSRKTGFSLRVPLAIWSSTLAVISIYGTVRCLPEFCSILYNQGLQASFCYATYYKDSRLMFWYLMFTLSKATELVDTVFIVLRKQKLIALHWIHHTMTLCFSWYVFGDVPATARWMVNMNFLIHSLMYSYYALKAFRISIRKFVNVSITTLQILQMIFGVYINFQALRMKLNGEACDLSISVAAYGFAVYSIFFILFLNYFWKTYLSKHWAVKSISYDINQNLAFKINNNNINNNNNNNNSICNGNTTNCMHNNHHSNGFKKFQ